MEKEESAVFDRSIQRRWVIGLRLITSAFIAAFLFLLRYHGPANVLRLRWFESGLTVIGIYILLAILHYRYSRPGGGTAGQILQIISDLALTICITLISGGGESPFVSLFLIVIINSSFLGGLQPALAAATFSAALWAIIISFPNMEFLSEWFSFPLIEEKASFSANQGVNILINTGACYLVAVLSGHLAGQIIQSRRALSRSQATVNSMEAELRRAEHLAALGEMAAGLAHEVRTPLASMTAAFHMLQNGLGNPEDQERLMAVIGREMERLSNLSNDFLSFARPSPPRPQAFNVNEIIDEQIKIFKYSLPESCQLYAKPHKLPPVYFDRDKFIQVLCNLLANALDACGKNENLQISVESALDPGQPRYALVRVRDNGPGIAPEILPKIFEPFFSTKSRGGGLGLPTVSRLLHEGGGGISASSTPRDGTVFTVFLPLSSQKNTVLFHNNQHIMDKL